MAVKIITLTLIAILAILIVWGLAKTISECKHQAPLIVISVGFVMMLIYVSIPVIQNFLNN